MSETKSKTKKASGCASGCGCNSKKEAAPAASTSETKSKTDTSSKTVSKSTAIQNGKGSAPRNMGPTFKKNFGKIKWGEGKKPRVEGRREVKVYG